MCHIFLNLRHVPVLLAFSFLYNDTPKSHEEPNPMNLNGPIHVLCQSNNEKLGSQAAKDPLCLIL